MTVWVMIFGAIGLLALSGVPGCLLPARSAAGPRIAAVLMAAGGALAAAAWVASAGQGWPVLNVGWGVPGSRFAVAVDPVSMVFLLPVFAVPLLGAVYGLGYWRPAEHPANTRRLGLFYGLLAGAMALVVVARDGVLFLVAWEVMALAAYFASTAEDEKPEVRRAGWVYLVATHVGTLCLLALFAGWRHATGSFLLEPGRAVPPEVAGGLFVLALVGFGFKAGLMPVHVWLPGAHANAPSHVSAVMSGVMLKMGVYGIVRMTALLPAGAAWWGGAVLAVGAVTSVAGIAFAVGQRDLKRLLAYSSIENMGVIAMGIGLALLGRSHGRPDWVLLGMGGALFHVWNHSLFKPLLFMAAGAVIHAAGTRDIDRMGGLAKRMPRVMALFAVGAVAICALPPLNGFASEWLLYTGLFGTLGGEGAVPEAALAAVALAMTGALAVACFVKALGAVFLGEPRGALEGHPPHEPGWVMLAPMVVLAALCGGAGLAPWLVFPAVEAATLCWWGAAGGAPVSTRWEGLAPLTGGALALLALVALVALLGWIAARKRAAQNWIRRGPTWDCGYARPTGRMQYTGSSLADTLVGLAGFLLWPKRFRTSLRGLFPRRAAYRSVVPDTVLERLVMPAFRAAGWVIPRLRVLQHGQTHVYVLYILLIVIVLLVWGSFGS